MRYKIMLRAKRGTGRRTLALVPLIVVLAALLVPVPHGPQAEQLKKSGTVTIRQTQIAFIGSANMGGGQLKVGGKTYGFSVSGLGIGGFGVSKMEAVGEVYNLSDVARFEGAYGQARAGFAFGDVSSGGLWLQNGYGVVLRLEAKRTGLALSLGADAVYIKLD